MAASLVVDGVIPFPWADTVAGDRRLIIGQAVSAYLMHELTQPHPGPDPIPNIEIVPGKETELKDAVGKLIDPYRVIVVIFLDHPPNRAAGRRPVSRRGRRRSA
ncbi:MAG TPA: hypothetical protein VNI54_03955 [Thermoanaerobaculia bacterium]|nr:hypothetical protein [Thermoanaerobaculia bacterium]